MMLYFPLCLSWKSVIPNTERQFSLGPVSKLVIRKPSMLTGMTTKVQSIGATNIPKGASSTPGIFSSSYFFKLDNPYFSRSPPSIVSES